jgi:hypothetical protein
MTIVGVAERWRIVAQGTTRRKNDSNLCRNRIKEGVALAGQLVVGARWSGRLRLVWLGGCWGKHSTG